MLRSILIALDGSPSSLQTADRGLELARRHQAHVEGLGIVNSAWIQRPEAVSIGGMAYKIALDLKELQSAAQRVDAVLRDFRERAEQAGIPSFQIRQSDGNPLEVLEVEAASHDLVVLGRHSMFDVDGELYELPLCVDRIIRGEPRPILLLPDDGLGKGEISSQTQVLVAFDGSPASSRAVHMFALLGLAAGRVIHVVTLDQSSPSRADETAARACALLRRHGAAETHAIGLGSSEAGTPAETILGLAKALNIGMIVMGAYGHRGIQEIFGSCTREVLNACPTALFLHH
ncbi:universal stress protein UspA [Microvirga sp. KLBC 81]|uniref:universal stress protein n=1 Tax=Microvirga sp. KLBC 81 TaxID=1862707 RepID=UPI000D50B942|nr:universal stress protein [Microvirga sp. KLBC 81]PVE25454.1 universal stress protein UspA [Microvirga sp. KLBC 81]